MKVSIIITTYNHLPSLRQTMVAFERVKVPAGAQVEVLLVDNACTDGTERFVEEASLPHMTCRGLHAPRKGKARALNLALGQATGDLLLFTDDDVQPAADWLVRMCERFQDATCDAAIGRVKLAPQLDRPWMKRSHRVALAATEGIEDGWLTEMIGANMAFRRRVLERVPRFDEELGPGAMGFGEETLFSWQLAQAGFRLGRAPDAAVEHHCDSSRLLRLSFLEGARKDGRGRAYLLHHWRHEKITWPFGRMAFAYAKLARRRVLSASDTRRSEGCSEWELSLTREIATYRQYLVERRRPRNYAPRGLVKLHP